MMARRSLLAAALVAVVLAGLLGPVGCLASAAGTVELPPCCAQRTAGAEPSCCCSAAQDRQETETPATPAPNDERSPAGLFTVSAAAAGAASAPGVPEPLDRAIAGASGARVHVVNCNFRC